MSTFSGFVHAFAPWAAGIVVVLALLQGVVKSRRGGTTPALRWLRWTCELPGLAVLAAAGVFGILPAFLRAPPSAAEEAELRAVYFRMQPACVDYLLAFAGRHEWRGGGSVNAWDSVQSLPPPDFTEENYERMRAVVESDYAKFATAMRAVADEHSILPSDLRALIDGMERAMRATQASYEALRQAPDGQRFAAQVRASLAAVRGVCDRVTELQAALPLP